MAHVGFAVQHPYPAARAVRVAKMAGTAVSDGHRVTILSPAGAEPLPDAAGGARVLHLGNGPWRRLFRPSPLSLPWLAAGVRILTSRRIDVLVVSDLKLAAPMLLAARACARPVLLDLGENFAAATPIWARDAPAWQRWLRSGPHIGWLERACIGLADRVQVVVEERRDDLLRKGWAAPERLSVLPNLPEELLPDRAVSDALCAKRERPSESPATLVYVGVITEDRGLDAAIRGVASINRRAGRQRCRLVVVGDGRYGERLRALAADEVARGDCYFAGWMSRERADEITLAADVGIIPHWVNEFTNTTIPNKLFDYMNCGIPVVASDMAPVERILRETGCGAVYDGSQPGFEAAVEPLLDAARAQQAGLRGRGAAIRRFHWDAAAGTFSQNLEDLLGGGFEARPEARVA